MTTLTTGVISDKHIDSIFPLCCIMFMPSLVLLRLT